MSEQSQTKRVENKKFSLSDHGKERAVGEDYAEGVW